MLLDQMIAGNDTVLKHIASEREKSALLAISPLARRAIKLEVIPQIEESVMSAESVDDLGEGAKRSIEAAFSYSNELYTRLVGYKCIDQSDDQFLKDLLLVMDEWMRKTKGALKAEIEEEKEEEKEESSKSKDKDKVKVKVEVEVNGDSSDNNVKVSKVNKAGVIHEAGNLGVNKGSAEDEDDTSTGNRAMLLFDLKDLRM